MDPKATEFGEITQSNYAVQAEVTQGHRLLHQSECDFLLVISTNLPHILHRFRAFDRPKIAIFGYPSYV